MMYVDLHQFQATADSSTLTPLISDSSTSAADIFFSMHDVVICQLQNAATF